MGIDRDDYWTNQRYDDAAFMADLEKSSLGTPGAKVVREAQTRFKDMTPMERGQYYLDMEQECLANGGTPEDLMSDEFLESVGIEVEVFERRVLDAVFNGDPEVDGTSDD